jgi:hypothetical protein
MHFISEELMKFDYCQFENGQDGSMTIFVGCSFEDEPDELYVIEICTQANGKAPHGLRLLFNGMDCKYSFKSEEKAAISKYVKSTLPELLTDLTL